MSSSLVLVVTVNTRCVARATVWLSDANVDPSKPVSGEEEAGLIEELESEVMLLLRGAIVIPGHGGRLGRPRALASRNYELKEEPQPQVDFAFGFLIAKPPPMRSSL